jgi:copper chaperone NosL
MKRLTFAASLALAALGLAGCNPHSTATKPPPVEMTDQSLGHYCQMYLTEHGGPKAQIYENGYDEPIWFAQVSDAIIYLHGAERRGDISAVYVSDMAKAQSWSEPGRANWTDADTAVFVIDSRQPGGMGTPEAIPFGTRSAAEAFVADKGGRIVAFADIPDASLKGSDGMGPGMEMSPEVENHGKTDMPSMSHGG